MKTVAACFAVVCLAARFAEAAPDPATTFGRSCSSCHTYGHGVRVGPDLKGATDRHSREWLAAWITSSETLVQNGDAAALALFNKFDRQRMPDQHLSAAELAALLDYLAAGGPETDARRRDRTADDATPAEIEIGRALFAGHRAFTSGGAACAACHRVDGVGRGGGTLGPDLSRSYDRFRDRGLATLLARGCFPRMPDAASRALTDEEAFALRAFLRNAARPTP
jgi:mono/diheme cytochrome c family protein